MPELPEVETIKLGAKKYLTGKTIKDVDIRVPKLFVGSEGTPIGVDKADIINAKIIDVRRVAKILEITLDNSRSILIHLKMTGQLVYQPKGKNIKCAVGGHMQKAYGGKMPHKHTHIIYTFSDGSKLYFNDLRKFGWNKILKSKTIVSIINSNFGPEPLTKDFTAKYLEEIFKNKTAKIKDVLLNQKLISGIGNIYANDALYWAGIQPTRMVKSLSTAEISKLKKAIEKVIKLGIKYGGSSENTYVDIDGKRGHYMDHTATYQQKKDPKGHLIIRVKMGSRSSFYCPKCQK